MGKHNILVIMVTSSQTLQKLVRYSAYSLMIGTLLPQPTKPVKVSVISVSYLKLKLLLHWLITWFPVSEKSDFALKKPLWSRLSDDLDNCSSLQRVSRLAKFQFPDLLNTFRHSITCVTCNLSVPVAHDGVVDSDAAEAGAEGRLKSHQHHQMDFSSV